MYRRRNPLASRYPHIRGRVDGVKGSSETLSRHPGTKSSVAPAAKSEPLSAHDRDALLGGACHYPHALLDAHPAGSGRRVIRVL